MDSPSSTTTSRGSSNTGRAVVWKHKCRYNIATCLGCDIDREANLDVRPSSSTSYSSFQSPESSASSTVDLDSPASIPSVTIRPPSPSSFRSGAIERSQLLDAFLQLYFPIAGHDTDFMYSKVLCREILRPVSPTMRSAIDALCLLQVGTSQSDQRLLHEAVFRYHTAIANLRGDLSAIEDASQDEGVLGTMYILGFCELFRAVSKDGRISRTHHKGLRDMLVARGPSSRYSRFGQLLLYNVRHISLIYGLSDRKRVAMSDPAWKSCAAVTSSQMTALTDLLLLVPGVLEQTESLLSAARKDRDALLGQLVRLTTLEHRLQSWLLRWLSSFQGLPHWHVKASIFAHFTLHTAVAPDVFTKALQFPSFATASTLMTYWIALLHIKQMILDVADSGYGHPLRGREQALKADATECAINLCQTAAFSTHPRHGSCGVMRVAGPLHYAGIWFAKQQDVRRATWCRKVKGSIEMGGIISPYTSCAERSASDTEPGE